MEKTATYISNSIEDTLALGRRIGEAAPLGTVIAARGDLGAGKTQLAAGIAAGLGITEQVTSPTYIFFNEYAGGRIPFCHMDAYRLEGLDEEEAALCGVEDCFNGRNILFAEWPDFVAAWLPEDAVELVIHRTEADTCRSFTFTYDTEKQGWLDEIIGH